MKDNTVNQEWFEMADVRRKRYNKAVWIPLRANLDHAREGKYGYVGYKTDFFGLGSLAVPIVDKKDAEKLDWMGIGIANDHIGWAE